VQEEDEEVPIEAADELGQDDDNKQTPAEGGEEDNADDHTNGNDEDDVLGAEPAPRCNLRANRERTYDHRLAQSMDNPESSESYDVQFLQHGASPHQGRGDPKTDASGSYDAECLKQGARVMPTLREAVEGYMASGSLKEVRSYILGFIMTQMTAKAGTKKHGQVAIDALCKEFLQLHDLGVFEGQHTAALTKDERRAALRAINLIKEKRCGLIKGRTVADGRKQRSLHAKEETASPTVSTDALMLSTMIDACKERDVATADVAGACLHADQEDFTLIKLEGASVDVMCDVCEEHKEFVTCENGTKVLCLRLLKALHGCVKSAPLWYELFTGTLAQMGFELNPCDACVANKIVNGKQCTVAWFVDDNKMSHVDSKVVTEVVEKIEERLGKMTVTRGKKHVFLRMKIGLKLDKFTVVCCPTEQMLADFFTKPLQGSLFRRLREAVMGRMHIDALKDIVSARSQERVGDSITEEKSETTADQPRTDENKDTCSQNQPRSKVKRVSHAEALMSVPQHQEETKEKIGATMKRLTIKK
jgi:hypothetical protein